MGGFGVFQRKGQERGGFGCSPLPSDNFSDKPLIFIFKWEKKGKRGANLAKTKSPFLALMLAIESKLVSDLKLCSQFNGKFCRVAI